MIASLLKMTIKFLNKRRPEGEVKPAHLKQRFPSIRRDKIYMNCSPGQLAQILDLTRFCPEEKIHFAGQVLKKHWVKLSRIKKVEFQI